jgi:DNA polymerase III epsilon subunit-like protein
MNYSRIASRLQSSPTPKERHDALMATYATQPLRLVLLEVLGLLQNPLCGDSSPALPLIEHCVVVAIDTEAWSQNTDEMTEIGIVIAECKDGKDLDGDIGDYAENVLKKMNYHFLRIVENAHLTRNAPWMRGADGNRFGQPRFVAFAEARTVLDEILNQPIVSDDPTLAGAKRPIVLMGHDLRHDTENVEKSGLAYNFYQHKTVVKEIDTQKLCTEVGVRNKSTYIGNKIGLDTLCEEVFNFAHEDPHTALNDAARTMICAVNLALRTWKKGHESEKTLQEVAFELEQHSQDTFESNWGTILCCTRCGGRDHSNNLGQCKAPVYCLACERFDGNKDEDDKGKHIRSHTEQFCIHVAEFRGWKRRVVDARRKLNHLPPGPPAGSHPPSKWRGVWPINEPGDALVPERPVTPLADEWFLDPVEADGLAATSAPVADVKVALLQSQARERAVEARRVKKQAKKPVVEKKDTWNEKDAWN